MSPAGNSAEQAKFDHRTRLIGAIVEIMRASWDTPADCNDGELFTYAEALFDRIVAGEDRQTLDIYLADVQTEKLHMPSSEAHCDILDRAMTFIEASG
jgi:hypothetical protein